MCHPHTHTHLFPLTSFVLSPSSYCRSSSAAKEHHGREKCAAEESETPVSGSAPLLLSDSREALLCPRLRERRRGTCLNKLISQKCNTRILDVT